MLQYVTTCMFNIQHISTIGVIIWVLVLSMNFKVFQQIIYQWQLFRIDLYQRSLQWKTNQDKFCSEFDPHLIWIGKKERAFPCFWDKTDFPTSFVQQKVSEHAYVKNKKKKALSFNFIILTYLASLYLKGHSILFIWNRV